MLLLFIVTTIILLLFLSLITIRYLLFIIYLSFIIYYSSFIVYYLLFVICYFLFIIIVAIIIVISITCGATKVMVHLKSEKVALKSIMRFRKCKALLSELQRGFDEQLLTTIFSHATLGNSIVAIISGVVAQYAADLFGFMFVHLLFNLRFWSNIPSDICATSLTRRLAFFSSIKHII